jgi:hypothetical protein
LRHATGERRIIGSATAELVSEFAAPGSFNHSLNVWVVTEPHHHRTTVMLSSEEPNPRDDHEFSRTDAVIVEEMLLSSTGLHGVRTHCLSQSQSHERGATPRPSIHPLANNPTTPPPPRCGKPDAAGKGARRADSDRGVRDDVYWDATANLVLDYFELLAGPDCGPLVDGFIDWLKRSPEAHRKYVEGDDMDRAALVERFLRLRALPRE